MYQMSMFKDSMRDARYLGSGVNANVHATGDGWVTKYAKERDGTLNWLEFCKHMQDAGKHMKGMPVIDRIVHLIDGYMVTMKEYNANTPRWPGFECMREQNTYLQELCDAYVEYANANWSPSPYMSGRQFGYYDLFNDCHYGNVMLDADMNFIVLDPDCCSYRVAEAPEEFALH